MTLTPTEQRGGLQFPVNVPPRGHLVYLLPKKTVSLNSNIKGNLFISHLKDDDFPFDSK